MKKAISYIYIFLFTIIFSCTIVDSKENNNSNETEFEFLAEQFADLKLIRYQIPGFENLSLDQKKLVYYLTQAGLSGRDIIWDQNYRHNLHIRKALDNINLNEITS